MNSEMFLTLPPNKLFWKCVIPAVITSVFGALYSVVDGVFVGRFLGEGALAAVNLIMPVIMIVEAVANMIATGASVQMSILLGEQKKEDASAVFSLSIKVILLLSCLLSVLGYFFAKPFVLLLAPGADAEAIRLSVEYLQVYALFGPLIPVYFATDNYLRVCGKQRFSMIVNVSSQGLNVVLDFFLIVILHQGVRAAAAASCLSIVLGSAATLAAFAGGRMDLTYTRKGIPFLQFLRILINGSSELFSNIAMSVMSIVMNLFLLKYGGTTAVAAFSIVMYVDSVIGMLCFGICDSLQPAISYCYGAQRMDRVRGIFRCILLATIVTAMAAFLFMFLAGPQVLTIFVKPGETELTEMSRTAVRIFAFSYLVGWADMCFSSFFTALERAARSLIVSFFGTLVFPIVSLFLLTTVWDLNGVWLMAPVSGAASAALAYVLAVTLRKELQRTE